MFFAFCIPCSFLHSPEKSTSQQGLCCCTEAAVHMETCRHLPLLPQQQVECVSCCIVPYASWHMRGTFPALSGALGLHTGSCCGAADWEQCVSVAGKEHLPAGFHGRWVPVTESFSKKVLAVHRKPRQLANCSKVREKYNPCTNWQINNHSNCAILKEFSHLMSPFRWICIYPEHNIAEPGLLSEQHNSPCRYFHENCLYSWPDLRAQSGEKIHPGREPESERPNRSLEETNWEALLKCDYKTHPLGDCSKKLRWAAPRGSCQAAWHLQAELSHTRTQELAFVGAVGKVFSLCYWYVYRVPNTPVCASVIVPLQRFTYSP